MKIPQKRRVKRRVFVVKIAIRIKKSITEVILYCLAITPCRLSRHRDSYHEIRILVPRLSTFKQARLFYKRTITFLFALTAKHLSKQYKVAVFAHFDCAYALVQADKFGRIGRPQLDCGV